MEEKNGNQQSTLQCFYFQRYGNCSKGSACPYLHQFPENVQSANLQQFSNIEAQTPQFQNNIGQLQLNDPIQLQNSV